MRHRATASRGFIVCEIFCYTVLMKKIVFVVCVLLAGMGGYLLLATGGVSPNQTMQLDTDVADTLPSETSAIKEGAPDAPKVTLSGTFVALKEGADRLDKIYQYLLLNTGKDVLRIDLRPLIGYSSIDTIGKLGVERGDEVTVVGSMNDEGFSIESIE